MKITLVIGCMVLALDGGWSDDSRQTAEDLPPPKATKSVLKDRPVAHPNDIGVQGWALTGVYARHYFFGTVAIAEYIRDGQHQIVRLEQESLPDASHADSNYLYYRETASGNRWAIGILGDTNQRHSVYFQSRGGSAGWMLWQHARFCAGGSLEGQGVAPLIAIEVGCRKED